MHTIWIQFGFYVYIHPVLIHNNNTVTIERGQFTFKVDMHQVYGLQPEGLGYHDNMLSGI